MLIPIKGSDKARKEVVTSTPLVLWHSLADSNTAIVGASQLLALLLQPPEPVSSQLALTSGQ